MRHQCAGQQNSLHGRFLWLFALLFILGLTVTDNSFAETQPVIAEVNETASTVHHAPKTPETVQNKPVSVTNKASQPTLKSTAKPKSNPETRQQASHETSGLEEQSTADQHPETVETLETTPLSITPEEPIDTEGLPILFNEAEQQKASQTSTQLMLRMVLSLFAVLGLFYACARWWLPQLMERYPAFFAQLKQSQGAQNAISLNQLKKQQNTPHFPLLHPAGKQKPNALDSRFHIVSSTSIGQDKELHVVEVEGRRLLIATTPYAVTFLKDLTGGLEDRPELVMPYGESINFDHWAIPSSSTDMQGRQSHIPSQEYEWLSTSQPSVLKTSYPEHSMRPRPESKPLASKLPLPEESEYTAAAHQQGEAILDETLHQKYLGDEPGAHEALAPETLLAAKTPMEALYIEPEEVIVLDDYDDVYPGKF